MCIYAQKILHIIISKFTEPLTLSNLNSSGLEKDDSDEEEGKPFLKDKALTTPRLRPRSGKRTPGQVHLQTRTPRFSNAGLCYHPRR